MHITDHDLGSWLVPASQQAFLSQAISEGRYVTEEELLPYEIKDSGQVKGLLSACPEDSLGYTNAKMRLEGERPDSLNSQNGEEETTFIHDPRPTYDFCENPSLLSESGLLSINQARETVLRPFFQLSKFSRNAELLTTPLDAYINHTSDLGISQYTPWEEKSIQKVFWRGSSTGDSYSARRGYDWRESHRPRLHLIAQSNSSEKVEIWVKKGSTGGSGGGGGGFWEREKWRIGDLNRFWLDVGLTGVHQCKEADGTCAEMKREIKLAARVDSTQAAKYKCRSTIYQIRL